MKFSDEIKLSITYCIHVYCVFKMVVLQDKISKFSGTRLHHHRARARALPACFVYVFSSMSGDTLKLIVLVAVGIGAIGCICIILLVMTGWCWFGCPEIQGICLSRKLSNRLVFKPQIVDEMVQIIGYPHLKVKYECDRIGCPSFKRCPMIDNLKK